MEQYGGESSVGFNNLAAKMQDQEETNAFLAEHLKVVRMQEEISAIESRRARGALPRHPAESLL